jgi:hypothetical protein
MQGGARLCVQRLESHPLRQPFKLQDFLRLSHRLSHFLRHFSLTFPAAQYLSLRERRRGKDSESLTDGEVQSERQVEEPAGSDVRNILFTIQANHGNQLARTRTPRQPPSAAGRLRWKESPAFRSPLAILAARLMVPSLNTWRMQAFKRSPGHSPPTGLP